MVKFGTPMAKNSTPTVMYCVLMEVDKVKLVAQFFLLKSLTSRLLIKNAESILQKISMYINISLNIFHNK